MSKKDGVLFLVIKEPWFSMIRDGIKKEEYRELKYYWRKRLLQPGCGNLFVHYDTILFSNGMTKGKDRRFILDGPKIDIGTGKPEWGAKPGKLYFVITWEEMK